MCNFTLSLNFVHSAVMLDLDLLCPQEGAEDLQGSRFLFVSCKTTTSSGEMVFVRTSLK